MLKKIKAFTLAEVMVVLAVMGILAAIMLPTIAGIRPNKNKAMFKKAYYIAERLVFEMVNDESLYPTTSDTVGLDNTYEAKLYDETFKGTDKFCKLFTRKVNTTSATINCVANRAVPTNAGPSFTTSDGIDWYMPITSFRNDAVIYVDVNGREKDPNCQYDANTCKRPDIFQIKVKKDGKMYVDGTIESKYLGSNDNLQDQDN